MESSTHIGHTKHLLSVAVGCPATSSNCSCFIGYSTTLYHPRPAGAAHQQNNNASRFFKLIKFQKFIKKLAIDVAAGYTKMYKICHIKMTYTHPCSNKLNITSCACGDTICPRPSPPPPVGAPALCAPPSIRNIAVVSHAICSHGHHCSCLMR